MLRELVDAWDNSPDGVAMGRREHQLIGLMVYGLTAHAHALARSVLALDAEDLDAGIVPLVRQAMECSTTAMWLELTGYPAVLTVLDEQSRQQRNLFDEFVKSGQLHDDGALESLEADLKSGLQSASKAGRAFHERCSEISGGATIYAVYRALSATSHAGASVVDLYLESTRVDEDTIDNTEDLALRRVPKANLRDEALGTLLSMLVAASLAWSRLDRDHYLRTRLKEMARVLKVAPRHQLTPHGLAQVSIRKREHRAQQRSYSPASPLDT